MVNVPKAWTRVVAQPSPLFARQEGRLPVQPAYRSSPAVLPGTAHPRFDADTDTRRRYRNISLRVNDCLSRIVFECENDAEWSRTEAQEETR